MRVPTVQIAIIALATGCATTPSHVGRWAHEDAQSYVGVALERDGSCKVIAVAKQGAGVGWHCSYSSADGALTITEVWDNSKVRNVPPSPMRMIFHPATDTISLNWGKPLSLLRVEKLAEE